MTKSNPYNICEKCRKAQLEQQKKCHVTCDVMLYCNCPDEEDELFLDKDISLSKNEIQKEIK